MNRISPAEYVISIFGGVRPLAKVIKRSPACVSRWKHRTGNIPNLMQIKILSLARKRGLDLSPDDLIYGRVIEK